jgi:Cdc6-like AAA superfamily ATPase
VLGMSARSDQMMGTSGTGKTTITKWILESYSKEISAYVNCWKYRTTHEVLKEILLELQIPVHGREPTGEFHETQRKMVGIKPTINGLLAVLFSEYFGKFKSSPPELSY